MTDGDVSDLHRRNGDDDPNAIGPRDFEQRHGGGIVHRRTDKGAVIDQPFGDGLPEDLYTGLEVSGTCRIELVDIAFKDDTSVEIRSGVKIDEFVVGKDIKDLKDGQGISVKLP